MRFADAERLVAAGFIIPPNDMPPWFKWYRYLVRGHLTVLPVNYWAGEADPSFFSRNIF